MTMALADMQRDFLAHLSDQPENLGDAITPGGRINVAQRLTIYHHAYRARLIEVLQDVFERTWAYLGDEAFADIAEAYIAAHPPSDATLQDFGQSLPDWLRERFPDDIDIAEVAMIDAMLRSAFEGADAVPLSLGDFAALTEKDWAQIGFAFNPTLRLVPIIHNAAGIWQALENNETPPPAAPLESPTSLLVWRKELRPHFITIGEIEANALQQMMNGESFAGACSTLDERFPDANAGQVMGVALRRWIDDQLIIGLRNRPDRAALAR
jgi:hypothetical protein